MDLVQVLPNALKCPCVSIKHALKKQGIKTLKPLISQGFQVSVSILVTQHGCGDGICLPRKTGFAGAPLHLTASVAAQSGSLLIAGVAAEKARFSRRAFVARPPSFVFRLSSKKRRVYGRNMVPFPGANCAGGPVLFDRLGRRTKRLPAALRRHSPPVWFKSHYALRQNAKTARPIGRAAFEWLRGWDLNHMTSGL